MPCNNRRILRKKLEPKIDYVLTSMLCRKDFLEQIVRTYIESARGRTSDVARAALAAQDVLKEKRHRVLDTFFDGLINE